MEELEVNRGTELSEGEMTGIEVSGHPMVLTMVEGNYYAVQGLCTHKKGRLWEGELNGFIIKCPRHGSEFDIRTGEVKKGPWIPFANAQKLKTYNVSVKDDRIFVEVPY